MNSNLPLKRLMRESNGEYGYMFVGILTGAAAGAVQPLFALIMGELFGLYFEPSKFECKIDVSVMKKYSVYWMCGFIALGVWNLVMYTVKSYLFGVVGERLTYKMRTRW